MTNLERRLEILRHAAEDGDIWIFTYDGGPIWVRSGKVDLGNEADRGDQALYVDELHRMEAERLIERRGKDYYRLTGAGFEAAKMASGKINLQETPTSKLVEMVKEQAELWEKPNEAMLKELMSRYRWHGCPKDDKVLIAALDSILRPLYGRSVLPPGRILLPGEKTSPPPQYYRDKVSLSQMINGPSLHPTKARPPETHSTALSKPIVAKDKIQEIKLRQPQTQDEVPETFQDVLRKPILKSQFRVPVAIVVLFAIGTLAVYGVLPDEIKLRLFNLLVDLFRSSGGK